mmetsp:Transcript_20311/g.36139  ORF Transcript_20311/g.36139 Transcript_20311/m.36139 type:complete len:434 (-) Transcript_20311:54-1355(-)|eukprot:CAMPEP_0184528942 /NCGR_PEP_ID=MMETSP0198_2-20121128/12084_1 /TAXON_ID=1112570 /ORGANISM="Thraustochytrium sp., Strain LLF1b" /LENGTH=433 /DNA_ID=CAMNT_0026920869 /DNA_START=297 /DNA_END=1598 /DNA_ORIENTATION=+
MLPTHVRQPPAAVKLQSALDKTLNMAGMQATKGGSGDKERAYIVRQNWVLKTVVLLIVIFVIGIVVLFSTVLKVSVTRRDAIKAEKMHHQLEHMAQVKLMRAHLELQRALEQEAHETSRLEEFRSVADRALGDHSISVKKMLSAKGVSSEILKDVEASDDELRQLLDVKMHNVLQHFHNVAANARESLKRVAHAIVSDAELEKRESDRFKTKMHNDFGVDISDDEDAEIVHHKKGDIDDYGFFQDDEDEEDEDDEEEITAEIERFFTKLKAHEFPLLDAKVIEDWEEDMAKVQRILDNEEQETDLESIRIRVNQKIGMAAPSVPKFDPAKHHSIIDYYEMRIEEAKLAFHRQALLDLYNGWKEDNKLSPFTVLSGLEHIAEENNMYLLYEWLDGEEGDEDDERIQEQVKELLGKTDAAQENAEVKATDEEETK